MRLSKYAKWIFVTALTVAVLPWNGALNGQTEQARNSEVEMRRDQSSPGKTPDQEKPFMPDTGSKEKKTTTNAVGMPVYKPPMRGAPGGRVGGGTRGLGEEQTFLCVLAPDHVGLTLDKQPCLYWFISNPTAFPIEFTLTQNRAVKPLLEKRLDNVSQAGIQCIRLANYGLSLRQNVVYKWFVTIVVDQSQRSKDLLAGGVIQRVDLRQELHEKLKKAGTEQAPHVFAQAGFWYDALAAISTLIDASPGEAVLREERVFLLEQVGLGEVSEYEKKHFFPPRR